MPCDFFLSLLVQLQNQKLFSCLCFLVSNFFCAVRHSRNNFSVIFFVQCIEEKINSYCKVWFCAKDEQGSFSVFLHTDLSLEYIFTWFRTGYWGFFWVAVSPKVFVRNLINWQWSLCLQATGCSAVVPSTLDPTIWRKHLYKGEIWP